MTQQQDIGLKPPAAPLLLGPLEEAIVDGRAVTFVWEPVEEATAYRLEVAADTAFEEIVFEKEVGDATTLTAKDVFPTDEATFYWRVIAENEAGESLGDVVESFISGVPEDIARHLSQPDAAESFGPLGGLMQATAVEVAAEATRAPEFYEAETQLGVQHEGIGAAGILGFIFATIAVIAMASIFVFFLSYFVAQETRSKAAAQLSYPELREVEARAANRLGQYDVVDDAEKVYQIPIDRAMELMVNRAYQQPGGDYSPELQLHPRNQSN